MVGKYTGLADSYLSVTKALQHACVAAARRLDLVWLEVSLNLNLSLRLSLNLILSLNLRLRLSRLCERELPPP